MTRAYSLRIPNVLLPTLVGVSVYLILNKFFPEQVEELIKNETPTKKDPLKDLRGGDIQITKLVERIVSAILHNRPLKVAIITIFVTAGYQAFHDEIVALLVNDVYHELCRQKVNAKLQVICDIIHKYELHEHAKAIRELLISNIESADQIKMLKLKLEYIFTLQSPGKGTFVIMAMISAICASISGTSALALLSDALYLLFKEGKIEESLYKQTAEIITLKNRSLLRKFMDRISRIRGGARVRSRLNHLISKDTLSLFLGIVVLFGLSMSAPVAAQTGTSLGQTQIEICHLLKQEHSQEEIQLIVGETRAEEELGVPEETIKASTQTRKSKERKWNRKTHSLKDLSPLNEGEFSEAISGCTSVRNKVERVTTQLINFN